MILDHEHQLAKEYLVKSYECDCHDSLRLVTLMNIFQDMAGTHAYKLGLGIDWCVENQMAWVCAGYHIKIGKLPKMHEKIHCTTWPAVENKLSAVREFVITDKAGEILITASSQWVLLGLERKRPLCIGDTLPQYPRFEQRALETDFAKIPQPERTDVEIKFVARFDDIDLNHHVNNAVYALWASEAVLPHYRMTHRVAELEIAFKKETPVGEKIDVFTQMDGDMSTSRITARSDSRELSLCRIKWVKI